MNRIVIPVIAAVFGLTGCSTADEPAVDDSSAAPTQQETTPEETVEEAPEASATIESVLEQLGATGYESSDPAPYTAEYGEAAYEGSVIQLYSFASEDDYTSFLDFVKAFGINESQFAKKDLVVVAPKDQTKLDSIRGALGL